MYAQAGFKLGFLEYKASTLTTTRAPNPLQFYNNKRRNKHLSSTFCSARIRSYHLKIMVTFLNHKTWARPMKIFYATKLFYTLFEHSNWMKN